MRTGTVPAVDLSFYFPRPLIAEYFLNSGQEVADARLQLAAEGLYGAWSELMAMAYLDSELNAMQPSARAERGAMKSLGTALSEIRDAAGSIAQRLDEIRSELLLRRAEGVPSPALERLHDRLHRSFCFGQMQRHWLEHPDDASFGSLLTEGETGSRASIAPTWLEDACNELASEAERRREELHGLSLPRVNSQFPKRAQAHVIERSAHLWVQATGQPATARSDLKVDDYESFPPFQTFLNQVCGHLAGLLLRRTEGGNHETFREFAERLGLVPPPSGSTIHRTLRGTRTARLNGQFDA
ncbi:MAG TPA: hypothetical protein VGU01_14680 [Sphingomicrobium sp.]|nr:hypothetical protein [Sphingomicrobium sp.]